MPPPLYYRHANKNEADDLNAMAALVMGYPKQGLHVGGGRHVINDLPGSPGYTDRWFDVWQDIGPGNHGFAVVVDGLIGQSTTPLSTPEKAQWNAKLALAAVLPPGFEPGPASQSAPAPETLKRTEDAWPH